MSFTPDLVEEMKILALYDLSSNQEGIKVHKTAESAAIAATRRLHKKGLITLSDGGYLTSLGLGAAEHVQALPDHSGKRINLDYLGGTLYTENGNSGDTELGFHAASMAIRVAQGGDSRVT